MKHEENVDLKLVSRVAKIDTRMKVIQLNKNYPIGMHRGTIYYATDRHGRNYYINFEPDPVEANPGTVEWYKKKMFG